MNEIQFVEYWTNNIKGQGATTEKINHAHFLLYGESPTDNCGGCVQIRLNDLMNKYTTLIKLDWVQEGLSKIKPVEPVKSKRVKILESLPVDKDTSYFGEKLDY